MTEKLLAIIFVFINSVITSTGYAGVVLLMAIESACIPLPSELIMPFAGYLAFTGRFKLLWLATFGALGCNLGSHRRIGAVLVEITLPHAGLKGDGCDVQFVRGTLHA